MWRRTFAALHARASKQSWGTGDSRDRNRGFSRSLFESQSSAIWRIKSDAWFPSAMTASESMENAWPLRVHWLKRSSAAFCLTIIMSIVSSAVVAAPVDRPNCV